MHCGYRRRGAADPMDACPYLPPLISLVRTGQLPAARTCISLPDSFLCPPPQRIFCCPLSKLKVPLGVDFSVPLGQKETGA